MCVIGSGAGGGAVAYRLAKSGLKIVVLEKGEYVKREDFSKDELALRRGKYSPNLKDEFHIIYEKEGKSYRRFDGREVDWSFWNGCIVGGASNFMSGYFHPLEAVDFDLIKHFGVIKGANLAKWPIAYSEFAPYYDEVDRVVGVSGKNKPYPPLQTNIAASWFDKACKKLSYESYETPRAILSQKVGQRDACYYSGFCGSYGCSSGAKSSSREALLKRCSAEIISQAFVYHLESNQEKVTKAHYFDKDGKSHTVEAKIFVVALGPIETSRLLLNSKNRYFPKGLANNANQVGKNLLFSAGGTGGGRITKSDLKEKEFVSFMRRELFLNRSLKQWYAYRDKDGKMQKGGVIDFLFEHNNIIPRVKSKIWNEDGEIIWGERLKQKILAEIPNERWINFELFCDWLPTDGTYVSVEKGVSDKWGVDVASIWLDPHKRDLEVGEFLASKAIKVLEAMGAKDIYSNVSSAPPPNLVAGGCRFGDDPKKSVLDKNCKAHELANLYVADASFMPNGGSVPYTYTIYANALRVADIIARRLS